MASSNVGGDTQSKLAQDKAAQASKFQGQTGPKSQQGKSISSKNALKSGVFAKGYLPWEDHEALDAQFEALCEQWGATDPSRQILVSAIHQSVIGSNRMVYNQQLRLEAAMQSLDVYQEFAKLIKMDLKTVENMPAWFFRQDAEDQKEYAIFITYVMEQANTLKLNYSDRLIADTPNQFPQLYEYIMKNQKPGVTFLMALAGRFKQSMPSLNLVALMNEIVEQYRFHLMWATHYEQYEILIEGIRAKKRDEVMDLEKNLRYATAFQNQQLKAFQGLDALNRLEKKGPYAASDSTLLPGNKKDDA